MHNNILIQNAKLLSLADGSTKDTDILVEKGIIKAIKSHIVPQTGWEVVNVAGAYVTVGWVDSHVHVAMNVKVNADPYRCYPADGVTYVIDAGSGSCANYETVHKIIQASPIPMRAYLHMMQGMRYLGGQGINEEKTIEVARKYPSEIIGIKLHADPRINDDCLGSIQASRRVADAVGLPFIIHASRCELPIDTILEHMVSRDTFAHSLSSLKPGIMDSEGNIKSSVLEARKRGVRFDMSHGSSNFSWETASKAYEKGFLVDTISTDMHIFNLEGPVKCIADCMSKMMHCGMSLLEVLERVISKPKELYDLEDKAVEIKVGDVADIAAFRVEQGAFEMSDAEGNLACLHERIVNVATVYSNMLFMPRTTGFYTTSEAPARRPSSAENKK